MLQVSGKRYLLRDGASSLRGVVVSLSGSLRTEGQQVSLRKVQQKQWAVVVVVVVPHLHAGLHPGTG